MFSCIKDISCTNLLNLVINIMTIAKNAGFHIGLLLISSTFAQLFLFFLWVIRHLYWISLELNEHRPRPLARWVSQLLWSGWTDMLSPASWRETGLISLCTPGVGCCSCSWTSVLLMHADQCKWPTLCLPGETVWPAQAQGWPAFTLFKSVECRTWDGMLADVVSYTVIIAYRPMRFSHVNFEM